MACKEVDRVKAGLKLNSPGVRLCVVSFSKNRIDVPAAVQDAHNFDGRFRYLSFRIPAACPLDHILDINFLPAARIERADTLLDVSTQTTELFDVGKQLSADSLLSVLG